MIGFHLSGDTLLLHPNAHPTRIGLFNKFHFSYFLFLMALSCWRLKVLILQRELNL